MPLLLVRTRSYEFYAIFKINWLGFGKFTLDVAVQGPYEYIVA